ncbi:MAG TPA: 2Fe-2S iron-sulfur cluster-binding protein [Holophagaceae bacterium]|nr:2Fe-2S iron-sulfur cluster-binding protein [Holophagaceae bacterium]
MDTTFFLDGKEIPFEPGQTVFDAAMAAGEYIPHLCHNPDYEPHSSCRLCTVMVNGRPMAACTQPAVAGQMVQNRTPDLMALRRTVLQMLFTEGNHYCPSCEKSGDCRLQASAYDLGMQDNHFMHQFPKRARDASHPDVMLDRDRCILCELCVRVSRDVDRKSVFGIVGRGIRSELAVNSPSGLLADSEISAEDQAVHSCPVGAILVKRRGFEVPIGERTYDREPISVVALREFQQRQEAPHGR